MIRKLPASETSLIAELRLTASCDIGGCRERRRTAVVGHDLLLTTHPMTGNYMRIAGQNAPSRYLSVYVRGRERGHLLHAFPTTAAILQVQRVLAGLSIPPIVIFSRAGE